MTSKKYNVHIFYTDYNVNLVVKEIFRLNPAVVVFFEIDSFQEKTKRFGCIFDLNIPVYVYLADTYYITSLTSKCEYINKADGLLFLYKNDRILNSYKRVFPKKNIINTQSRYVNTDIYRDYKLEKKYDILLYGTRTFMYDYKNQQLDTIQSYIKNNNIDIISEKMNFYPLRAKLERILLENRNNYKVIILEPNCLDGPFVNEQLSMLINQSYLTVACSAIADILLDKQLEIPASNSVILGSYPSDYKDLFEGNIVNVNEFMTDEEILDIIDKALADKNSLIEMSNRLYARVHEEHSLKNVGEDFDNLFSNIIEISN
jgi:hypothetical protein